MRKIIFTIFMLSSLSAFTQNQEVVYESIYLTPEKTNELNLIDVKYCLKYFVALKCLDLTGCHQLDRTIRTLLPELQDCDKAPFIVLNIIFIIILYYKFSPQK